MSDLCRYSGRAEHREGEGIRESPGEVAHAGAEERDSRAGVGSGENGEGVEEV